jgi:hypothetical protein
VKSTLQDFGYDEARATNAARDAVLDGYQLTTEQRAQAIADFAEATARPIDKDNWWGEYATQKKWTSKG